MIIENLAESKKLMLEKVVTELGRIKGVEAVVLGGSYASGIAHEGSDLDIGIYYEERHPFAVESIQLVAAQFTLDEQAQVTDFYGWGQWVNGGGWLHTPHGKVDFIYRNIDQVKRTIENAKIGILEHDYDQQPAYGFYSVIYLAETEVCIPLYDPHKVIEGLKQEVKPYPPRLKQAVTADLLWAVEFALLHARGFAEQGDVYNTAGCLTRSAGYLTQVLFTQNERYFIRDKQVMREIAGFSRKPEDYGARMEKILSHPGSNAADLGQSVYQMQQLWREVTCLEGVDYSPKFQI